MTESRGETVRTWFVLSLSPLRPHIPPTAVVRLIPQNPLANEMFETTIANYRMVIPTHIILLLCPYFRYNDQGNHPATR